MVIILTPAVRQYKIHGVVWKGKLLLLPTCGLRRRGEQYPLCVAQFDLQSWNYTRERLVYQERKTITKQMPALC